MSWTRPVAPSGRQRARLHARVLMLLVLAHGACTDTAVDPITVASVELTPPAITVRAGNSVTLAARPLDAAGNAVDVRTILWSSSNAALATVSSSGVVTALAPGDVRIAASVLGKSATARVTVTARVVASVIVSPATVSVRVGTALPLQALTLDADGGALTGRAIVWTSSNTSVATVSAQGVVTGIAAGAATVTATSDGRSGQSAVTVTVPPVQTVTVTPAVDTLALGATRSKSAVLRDAAGALLTDRTVAWTSSNVTIATVSSTGVVTARAPGTASIVATSEGRVGAATVVVLARLADAVTLTPLTATLVVGATQQIAAQVTDPLGTLLVGRPIVYRSDAATVASVDANGLVTALTPGVARITVISEGKSAVATITVIAEPVATLAVSPTTASLLIGATQQLSVTARSAAGALISGRPIAWTSGSSGVASASPAGLVTAIAPGIVVVLAVVEGVTAISTITVRASTVATVSVTPVIASIGIGTSQQLTATARDALGATLAGRPVVWSSADETIAFVSSSGLVVGFRLGTVRINATVEGVSGSTTVTVR